VLSDEVWIECLDDKCSGEVIELMKTLNLSRANWCVRDNKLKMITKELNTNCIQPRTKNN